MQTDCSELVEFRGSRLRWRYNRKAMIQRTVRAARFEQSISASSHAPCTNPRRAGPGRRHWIEYGHKRQSEQPDRSFQVCCRRANQLGEISDGADLGLCALALGVILALSICKLAST